MIKEYKWIGNTYMTNLMIDVNKDACKGQRLVNSDIRFFIKEFTSRMSEEE